MKKVNLIALLLLGMLLVTGCNSTGTMEADTTVKSLKSNDVSSQEDYFLPSTGAFNELDTIQYSINYAMLTINTMHQKVSLGMELSDNDVADYKEAISSYMSEVQNYATQQLYALTLAVNQAYDKDDEMGKSILDSNNQFYNDKLTELQDLGTQLNEAITEAFADELLDIDETKEIQELLQPISEIQNMLASSN